MGHVVAGSRKRTPPIPTWQYLHLSEAPDLDRLGADGWELVAVHDGDWIFKRPTPPPEERFTLEQRDAALAAPEGDTGKSRQLLNPEVAALIRRVNHTQMLLLADRGFPLPPVPTVDLSLTRDIPTIPQVLAVILPDLPADRLIIAEEQRRAAPERWQEHQRGPCPSRRCRISSSSAWPTAPPAASAPATPRRMGT